MNIELENFLEYTKIAKENLSIERQAASKLNCLEYIINTLDKIIILIETLEQKAKIGDLKVNYLNQFQLNIDHILFNLVLRGHKDLSIFTGQNKALLDSFKQQIENQTSNISAQYNQIEFNIYFFDKIGYFNNNVVAIGANGSGKTSLSNKFKDYLEDNGMVISAQRILLVPNFDGISNPSTTAKELKQSQIRDKSNKNESEFSYLQLEFAVVLKNLLADNSFESNQYRKESLELASLGEQIKSPNPTNLDIAFEIWNSLIEHKNIYCDNGINIMAKSNTGTSYPVIQMSDGEKVMLYLIAQVLQAPINGFIVVDEPEMYLHKTILKRLWDILENKRVDCLFIYLTHDLDFATSRTTAKKIWIKSFIYPDKWEIEDIPTDEIPEALLFELLGSRKNILFCEGVKGSIDEKVYSILFPELTIIPVASCFDVINHTKAFNKLQNININAFGLIDSDHHDVTRFEALKENNIYSFKVAEIENLFLDEDFLKILAKQIMVNEESVELIKSDIINELEKSKEVQASNYVSAKVNYYFSDSDISKGNTLSKLENNYNIFLGKISIENWYNERISELNQIITDLNYNSVLISLNNKGIRNFANKHLKITNFTERSLKLLQSSDEAKLALNKYFPEEIKVAGQIKIKSKLKV